MSEDSRTAEVAWLIGRAQQGDEDAAETLLQWYRPLVQQVAHRYYLPDGDSEDVLQIGMIGLWQAIVRYNPERSASFASFARLCIQRQILSAIRRATRMVCIPFPPCPDPDTEDYWANLMESAPSALDLLIEREQVQELEQRLSNRLSTLEAQVLELWSQRRTYREIAAVLGCSRKAVDNALTRIKRKVRRAKQG